MSKVVVVTALAAFDLKERPQTEAALEQMQGRLRLLRERIALRFGTECPASTRAGEVDDAIERLQWELAKMDFG